MKRGEFIRELVAAGCYLKRHGTIRRAKFERLIKRSAGKFKFEGFAFGKNHEG